MNIQNLHQSIIETSKHQNYNCNCGRREPVQWHVIADDNEAGHAIALSLSSNGWKIGVYNGRLYAHGRCSVIKEVMRKFFSDYVEANSHLMPVAA